MARPQIPLQMAPHTTTLLPIKQGGSRSYDVFILSGDSSGLELVLPREQSASEYLLRVQGALKTLEVVEDRPLSEVAADIVSIGFDVLKSRLPNDSMLRDSIHLDAAVAYMTSLKNMMASAATTELNPAPFYGRVRKDATAYTERCMFGHTFKGSFGFTIQSPLTLHENVQNALFEETIPFERRVIQRLAQGVSAIQSAASTDSLSAITSEQEVSLSANGLEIFADLIEQGGGAVGLSFDFSREVPANSALESNRDFTVSQAHVEVAREAARILRKRPISKEAHLLGNVITLRNETDPTQLMEDAASREVQIAWESEDFGKLKVRVALNAPDYLSALKAHANGRPVSVLGMLEKVGMRWFLRDPKEALRKELIIEPDGGIGFELCR
jgi:hypothetical protein